MQVTIMYRNNWKHIGGDGWTYYPLRIQIADNCPRCGCKRGKPYSYRFCENGEWFVIDRWDNLCGHIDTYSEAYLESKLLKITK